jgi:post-segregation antitoxin (ccd killing protein)
MLTYMDVRRTTLILPEPLDAALRQEAARRGVTVSALTREAIAAHLGMHAEGTTGESDDSSASRPRRRLSFTGAGASGRSDISERIEEILREDFGRDR